MWRAHPPNWDNLQKTMGHEQLHYNYCSCTAHGGHAVKSEAIQCKCSTHTHTHTQYPFEPTFEVDWLHTPTTVTTLISLLHQLANTLAHTLNTILTHTHTCMYMYNVCVTRHHMGQVYAHTGWLAHFTLLHFLSKGFTDKHCQLKYNLTFLLLLRLLLLLLLLLPPSSLSSSSSSPSSSPSSTSHWYCYISGCTTLPKPPQLIPINFNYAYGDNINLTFLTEFGFSLPSKMWRHLEVSST